MIRYFFIILLLFLIYRTAMKWRTRDLRFKEFLFWNILWLSIGIVVIYPKTASLVAQMVGVGRGADLVVYSSLLLIFYLLFRIFMHLEKTEQQITKIVIDVALKEKDNDAPKSFN